MMDFLDFREVYLEELEEQLQMLEEEIMRLENEGESVEGIQRMFRVAHTLKGSSAAMGFHRMKSLTHEMEHCLDNVRNRRMELSNRLIQVFFQCFDRMKRLQNEIVASSCEQSEIEDLVGMLQALDMAKESAIPIIEEAWFPGNEAPFREDRLPDWKDLPIDRLRGGRVLHIRVTLEDDSVMKVARLSVIDAKLQSIGFIIWRQLPVDCDYDREDIAADSWLLETERSEAEIRQLLQSLMDVKGVLVEERALRKPEHAIPLSAEMPASESDKETAGKSADVGEKYKSNTIRVNVDRLDKLMNFVGELVIEHTRLQQIDKIFRLRFGTDDLIEDLNNITDHLGRIAGEIQSSVMEVRMLPIEQLYNRFPRMVRDLSQSLGKEVQLVLEGKETELDRSLIQEIGDPLIHLIRNAIDHGIEPAEVRRASGKAEEGTLRIVASHEDNSVLITVQDDGGGIDTGKLRRAAVSKGLYSEEEAAQLSESEAVNLIFHSGFSTAAVLSEVSGRGVGMDIVRTDIERLNGTIDIETVRGEGTIFRIKLPLTLAIITGLLVKIGMRLFVLPMSNIAEIIRIKRTDVRKVRGLPVVTLREQIIPLIWIHDYFKLDKPKGGDHLQIVVLSQSDKKLAIVVDELKGNQEIVIKSLGSYIGKLEGITGATILGDGSVALIFEVGGIFKMVSGLQHVST